MLATTTDPQTPSYNKVLLVEDDATLRIATSQTLELIGCEVVACPNAEQAILLLKSFNGVIVTDVRLPGQSGMTLLRIAQEYDSAIPVIVITGHGDVEMAVEAMRHGAYDFIEKPFTTERLLDAVRRAQEKWSLVQENRHLKKQSLMSSDIPEMIGTSAAMEKLRVLIQCIGPTNADILINGQTGTGKEITARQLHAASARKGKFVAINCGALPESVFESEIFGHEAGAFTGALKRRIGKLEYANGGTVFLDEIESMPIGLQVKLLRVLQEKKLERLGGNESIPIDCRFIAASKADLLKLSQEGKFREDLYYRLGVISVDLPRLIDRREDIPLLLSYFIQQACIRYQRPAPLWRKEDMIAWQMREWPGNVRELRNFADRIVLGIGSNGFVSEPSLAEENHIPLPQKVDAYEKLLISSTMQECQDNVAQCALQLGIPKKTLYDKLKKYSLSTGRNEIAHDMDNQLVS